MFLNVDVSQGKMGPTSPSSIHYPWIWSYFSLILRTWGEVSKTILIKDPFTITEYEISPICRSHLKGRAFSSAIIETFTLTRLYSFVADFVQASQRQYLFQKVNGEFWATHVYVSFSLCDLKQIGQDLEMFSAFPNKYIKDFSGFTQSYKLGREM